MENDKRDFTAWCKEVGLDGMGIQDLEELWPAIYSAWEHGVSPFTAEKILRRLIAKTKKD